MIFEKEWFDSSPEQQSCSLNNAVLTAFQCVCVFCFGLVGCFFVLFVVFSSGTEIIGVLPSVSFYWHRKA